MLRKLIFLLIFLSTLNTMLCSLREESEGQHHVPRNYNRKYIFIFTLLLIVGLTRHIFNAFEIPVPYSIVIVIIGILWGVGMLYVKWMNTMADFSNTSLGNVANVLLPAMIFKYSFSLDVHTFLRSIWQILIISLLVSLLSVVSFGFLTCLLIDSNWTVADGILFGTISCAIYPMDTLRWLRESSIQTKHLRILLEGELLLSATIADTMFQYMALNITGWTTQWYQFIVGLLRTVFIALPVGAILGVTGMVLMRLAYNDTQNLMILTLGMSYVTFFFGRWLANGGIIATMIAGIIMGQERTSLAKEVEEPLVNLWKTLLIILNGVFFMIVGIEMVKSLNGGVSFEDYWLVLASYLLVNLTRFFSFFVFSPILSRLGYGMSFKDMLIVVWAGLKNPLSMNFVEMLVEVYPDDKHKRRVFFLHHVGVYILMLLINGSLFPTLLKLLGLSGISLPRQINMNNCLKFIYEAKARTVAILKMDRFLADANWPEIISATTLKHPYKKTVAHVQIVKSNYEEDEEDEDDFLLSYKFTYCPDCQKNVLNEPTEKEFADMLKEARFRILNLKKTTFSRQFENGMISKEGIRRLHQAVEIAMDSKDGIIHLDGLERLFSKQGYFFRVCKTVLNFIFTSKANQTKPPRKYWRLICYKIARHKVSGVIIYTVILTNSIITVVSIEPKMQGKPGLDYVVAITTPIFFLVYLIEFILKVAGYSWIYVCKHGFSTYFRIPWNYVEFVTLVMSFVYTNFALVAKFDKPPPSMYHFGIIFGICLCLRLLRLWKLLQYLAFFKPFSDSVSKFLDSNIDQYKAVAFELGKNYMDGTQEILDNITQIVDNEKIRAIIKEKMETHRLQVAKKLGIAQKDIPTVTTTVKTKIAVRTVLTSMKDDIKELKASGWIDDIEYELLLNSLSERYKFIKSLHTYGAATGRLLFQELAYMGKDDELIDFLYSNALKKKFNPGDVIIDCGAEMEGVYILITGMLFGRFTPTKELLERIKETGNLPTMTLVSSLRYDEEITEYIVPGNSVGEVCVLTGKPYDAVITSETHSLVYVLTRSVLQQAFKLDPDPIHGLECRMWKCIGFRRALTVLTNVPSYKNYTQTKLKFILERGFTPNLSNYKVFNVNEMIEDIILIEGIVVDFNTREIYVAPCYIPRACQRLMMPSSGALNLRLTIETETKLMIIPAKDFDEYEIMLKEEETCELVDYESSKCLLHLVKEKESRAEEVEKVSIGSSSRSVTTKRIISASKHLRNRVMGISPNSSRISKSSRSSKISSSSKHSKAMMASAPSNATSML